MTSPTSAPVKVPSDVQASRSRWRLFFSLLLLVLALSSVFAFAFYQAVLWFAQIAVTAPQDYSFHEPDAEEKMELAQLEARYRDARTQKYPLDFWLSERQFNYLLAGLTGELEARNSPDFKGIYPRMRLTWQGNTMRLRGSTYNAEQKHWINFEMIGALWVVDRKIKWRLDDFVAGQQSAPWLAQVLLRREIDALIQQVKVQPADALASPLLALKTVELRNERLHVVLDGKFLPEWNRYIGIGLERKNPDAE